MVFLNFYFVLEKRTLYRTVQTFLVSNYNNNTFIQQWYILLCQ